MYLDYFTLSALVDEFMDTLVGGRIQDVLDVDRTGIGFEVYANHRRRYLYISADNRAPHLYATDDRLRRGLTRPTQVGLLLRRFVEGGGLTHVHQPPWERLISFEIEGPEGPVELIVEPMERRANVLLVQDGVILDCMRRVGPTENRVRLSLPAHAYVPPPPQTGKREPAGLQVTDMLGFLEQADAKRKTYQVLTGHVLGMSPMLAKEIVFRASGDAGQMARDADPDALLHALNAVIDPLLKREWQPGLVERDGLAEAFSVYPLTHMDGWTPVETVSEALAVYYGAPVGDEAYRAAKEPVLKVLDEARGRLRGKLASLERSQTDDSERERLRQSGELILAYQYGLEAGQTELRAQYEADAPELVIDLDPAMSPLENAQRYFNQYNKAKRALDDVPQLIEETRVELGYLDQLAVDLDMASSWPDIDDVQQALQASGYWQGKRPKRAGGGQSAPLRVVSQDGFVIWVGRNSRQNDIVTFKKSSKEDLWLHARNVPGAHVIVKFDGRTIPDPVIDSAAALAAHYSALRGETRVPVDVTRIKYVRKIKSGGPGMVTYRNEETRTVAPVAEKDFDA